MADDDRTDEQPPGDRVPADERPGGAGSGTAGGVLESPGTRPASEDGEDEEEKTLAQELVEEAPGVEEVSPDMGTTRADPGAGGELWPGQPQRGSKLASITSTSGRLCSIQRTTFCSSARRWPASLPTTTIAISADCQTS